MGYADYKTIYAVIHIASSREGIPGSRFGNY